MPAPLNVRNQYGSKLTRSEVIKRFREVYGDRYDYSEFEYVNTKAKSMVYCPEHGVKFEISLTSHYDKRMLGCNECVRDNFQKKMIAKTPKVIEEFKNTHEDRYDYSKFLYKGSNVTSEIRCKEHNVTFMQSAEKHKRGNLGCIKCKVESKIQESKLKWIKDCGKLYGDNFEYDKIPDWKGTNRRCTIICKRHGNIVVYPNNHRRLGSCRLCTYELSKGRYSLETYPKQDLDKPAKFYHVRVIPLDSTDPFEKVGITTLSINERFYSNSYNIEPIRVLDLSVRQCIEVEESVMVALQDLGLRYKVRYLKTTTKSGGWTECFPQGSFDVGGHLKENFPYYAQ